MSLIYFSCQIAVAKTSSTILNKLIFFLCPSMAGTGCSLWNLSSLRLLVYCDNKTLQLWWLDCQLWFPEHVPVRAFKMEKEKAFLWFLGPLKLWLFFPSQHNGAGVGLHTWGLLQSQAGCDDQTHQLLCPDSALVWACKVEWEWKPCHSLVPLICRVFSQLHHCLAEF